MNVLRIKNLLISGINKSNLEKMTTARRALNCLQYEPNGKNIVGLSSNHKSNQLVNTKQALLAADDKLNKLKKRNSISLPDITIFGNFNDEDSLNKSATSTPCRKTMKKISASKSNISIIYEDKENPNLVKAKLEKMKNMESKINRKLAMSKALKEEIIKVEQKEMSIQCNKAEEDMIFGDSVKGTDYWRLIAHKRLSALAETKKENLTLHTTIEKLNEKNESLRQNIKELYEVINQYKELQKQAIEAEESDEVDDSGYDL